MWYLCNIIRTIGSDRIILSLWVPKSLARDYLNKLEWIHHQADRSLRSKMVNFRVATKYKNGSLISGEQDELRINFRMESVRISFCLLTGHEKMYYV